MPGGAGRRRGWPHLIDHRGTDLLHRSAVEMFPRSGEHPVSVNSTAEPLKADIPKSGASRGETGVHARQTPNGSLPVLGLTALGIVFGDIGTSPLYTFKTILGTAAQPSDPATVLGALSLVLWTLVIVTTIKYVVFAMRVDNDGEGGILALMGLLGVKKRRPTLFAGGIWVLSALEGLNRGTPAVQPYVVPAAVAILLALFAIQSQGTARIGHF